jgi:hypothetical protein
VVKKTKDEDGTEKIIVRKKENDNERWVECSERISSKRKEVPWYLVICYKYILPPFHNTYRFDFSRYIHDVMYLDISNI